MGEFNSTYHYQDSAKPLNSVGSLMRYGNKTGDFPFTSHKAAQGFDVTGISEASKLVNYGQSPGPFPFDSYDAATGADISGVQEQTVTLEALDSDRLTAVGATILNFLD